MTPVAEIRFIVGRELRRSIRSLMGIILGGLTLVGSIVATLACIAIEGAERSKMGAASTEQYVELKKAAIEKVTGDASLASFYATVPYSLLLFLKITIWLGPLLIALMGFDSISGDMNHRTVRFWMGRSRRWSYFLGKLIGLWILVSLVTLVLNLLSGTAVLIKGYVTIGMLANWGVRFWLVSLPISAAWAAIAVFISSRFKTPLVSLLTIFGTFFLLWVVNIAGLIKRLANLAQTGTYTDMRWYEYVYPNNYDDLLLSREPTDVLKALAVLVGFSALMTALGSLLFSKRDV